MAVKNQTVKMVDRTRLIVVDLKNYKRNRIAVTLNRTIC